MQQRISSTALASCACLGTALLFAPEVFAVQTFTVNSTLDQVDDNTSDTVCHTAANTCTLRAAVMQANRAPTAGATIMLPAGVYTLTRLPVNDDGDDSGDLNMTTPVNDSGPISLVGAGVATTVIDANRIDRILHVGVSRTASVSGVTFRHGYSSANGGGIFNEGILTLDGVVVTANEDIVGGGITNFGSLIVHASTVSLNIAMYGGGIDNDGDIAMNASTIAFNTAREGGGIENLGTMALVNTTIAGNDAINDGGGFMATNFSTTHIYNSTIAYNDADQDRDGIGFGGGVYISTTANFNLRNTLLAGNTVENTPIYDDCDGDGQLVSYGRNVLGTDASTLSGCNIVPSSGSLWDNLNSLNFLGGLASNGGPTPTIALINGNNSIDAGDPAFGFGCRDQNSAPITVDQRGFARPAGSFCDIGAFEYGAVNPVDEIFKNGFE
ncbi:MAG: choice-of-anchor Q domain-containing protein [Dokdonella sp.]